MFLVFGSTKRSIDHFTDAAVSFSPLWNSTSLRSLNCQVRSSRTFHEDATQGTILYSQSRVTSWSNIEAIIARGAPPWVCCGARLVTSAPWTTVRVPVGAAPAAGAEV